MQIKVKNVRNIDVKYRPEAYGNKIVHKASKITFNGDNDLPVLLDEKGYLSYFYHRDKNGEKYIGDKINFNNAYIEGISYESENNQAILTLAGYDYDDFSMCKYESKHKSCVPESSQEGIKELLQDNGNIYLV